jgi:3-methyladenine DNA glycosylase AlkC
MAAPLKDQFGAPVIERIAREIRDAHPPFDSGGFTAAARDGFDALELMPRGRHIARALRRFLPEDVERALAILVDSLGPREPRREGEGMTVFRHLPHVLFVEEFGLDHFDASMRAQHELTKRFTAEFSIRAFLRKHPDATLRVLRQWASDPDHHVRRLVSEGTRPRLPWAQRLPDFQRDPQPVLALLELLKDDPEVYVRRSVANNLNDIGKDHPQVLLATARRWLASAPATRRALVAHALRGLLRQGDDDALHLMGVGRTEHLTVDELAINPSPARIGDTLRVRCTVRNAGDDPIDVRADLRVHFVKADGSRRPKVFRMASCRLDPGGAQPVAGTVSLRQLSTRTHYPGEHRIEVVLNGQSVADATVDVSAQLSV